MCQIIVSKGSGGGGGGPVLMHVGYLHRKRFLLTCLAIYNNLPLLSPFISYQSFNHGTFDLTSIDLSRFETEVSEDSDVFIYISHVHVFLHPV
jgi:hypothetical protein